MPRRKPEQLFKKEALFAEKMGAGVPQIPAAKAAGYADPSSEAASLLARPGVRDRVIELLQRKAVRWEQLLDWSLHRLQEVLAPIPVCCEKCGHEVWTPPNYRPETILYAVKINLDSAQKLGLSESLRDRARFEDATDTKSIAQRMLGDRPGVGEPPPSEPTH